MCFHLRSVVGGYMFTILDCSPVVSVNRRPFALILSQEIDKYILKLIMIFVEQLDKIRIERVRSGSAAINLSVR